MTEPELSSPEAAPVAFLPPHKYPVWLLAAAVLFVLMAAYSVVLLPKYYSAARLLDKAENEDVAQHLPQSLRFARQAMEKVPDSKKARLQVAYECFKLNTADSRMEGMAALNELHLDNDEFAKLTTVMNDEDKAYFHSDGGK